MSRHQHSLVELLRSLQTFGPEQPLLAAEIGVCGGFTSKHILRKMPTLHLMMIDMWAASDPNSTYARSGDLHAKECQEMHDAHYREAEAETAFAADRRILIRGRSVEVAEQIANESLDLAFIDAEHTYPAVKADRAAWWPKVKPGGILCGHDYRRGPTKGVMRAVNEWIRETGYNLQIHAGSVWAVRKPDAH